MYHGLKFASDGRCVEIPGEKKIPDQFRVHSYPVVEMHSWVWIWIGDPATSKSHLIPPAIGLEDPQWSLKAGSMDYAANYLLINDNLLDLSHVAYVHHKGLRGDGELQFPVRISKLERGLNIQRWRLDQDSAKYIPGSVGGVHDEFLCYDFLMPGIFLMYSGLFERGTAVRCDFGKPDEKFEPVHAQLSSQAVTGLTDGSSRYFFSVGARRKEHDQHPGLVELLWNLTCRFFAEDKEMIEAQQKSILANPSGQMNSIASDRGPAMMRQIMDKYMNV